MVDLVDASGNLNNKAEYKEAILAREELSTTAVGEGIAIPHAKTKAVKKACLAAGITKDGLIMRMKEEDFDRVIDVNLKGTFNCIRHVSRYMLKQRSGRIINMSSVVGIAGNAGQVNYSASKAGVIGITKSAAKELASRGITVNAVAPGYIDTDMTKVLSDEQKKSVLDMIPLSRMGSVDDISNAVAFLASDEAAYITGQVISVDGGMNI